VFNIIKEDRQWLVHECDIYLIRLKCSLINQQSSANHCYYVQVCTVLHYSSRLRSKACDDLGIRTPTYRNLSRASYLQSTLTLKAPSVIVSTLLCAFWRPIPDLYPPQHTPSQQQSGEDKDEDKRKIRHRWKRQQSAVQVRSTAKGAQRGALHSPRAPLKGNVIAGANA
jgi:hypothetical protein